MKIFKRLSLLLVILIFAFSSSGFISRSPYILRSHELLFIDSDVSHGITNRAPDNAFGRFLIDDSTAGGLRIYGLSDTDYDGPLQLNGIIGSTNPTDTYPALVLTGEKKNGADTQALGAAETVLQIRNGSTALITVMGDGDVKFGTVATPRLTIGGGTNDDGITFGSHGTATKLIDFSGSGLAGGGDNLLYFSATSTLLADERLSLGAGLTKLNRLTLKGAADETNIGGTTTANATTAITGVGTAFTTKLGIGDRISVSSAAATYATVTAIASDTALTVSANLGDGTSQTINAKHAIYRAEDASGNVVDIINDQGYSGKGTTSPASALNIGASTDTAGKQLTLTSDSGNLRIYVHASADAGSSAGISRGAKINTDLAYPLVISHDAAQPLVFGTSDTERMRITSTGNIGMNTTSFGTSLAKGLAMGNGTAATGTLADGWQAWSADFLGTAGDARLHIIGEGSATARTVIGSGKVTNQGTTGGYTRQPSEATATLAGASTVIQVNIPSGAKLHAVQFRVDTAITSGDGATSWAAAYSGGSTTALVTGQAFTLNTKANKIHVDEIAASEVDITITPNSGTFSGGVIRAIAIYDYTDTMANAA